MILISKSILVVRSILILISKSVLTVGSILILSEPDILICTGQIVIDLVGKIILRVETRRVGSSPQLLLQYKDRQGQVNSITRRVSLPLHSSSNPSDFQ